MKTSLVILLLSSVLGPLSHAATVMCGKTKPTSKTLYPVNNLAIQMAIQTNLKTCNRSKRFKKYITSKGHTASFRIATDKEIESARTQIESGSKGKGSTKGTF